MVRLKVGLFVFHVLSPSHYIFPCCVLDRTKTGTSDVTGATEERRVDAKQLLLDIEDQLGKEKLAEVVNAIKRLHQKPISDLKSELVEVLKGHAELLQRFLEFLPRRFRF